MFAAPVNRLITELARLPGIGQRTAQRLAFHILSVSDEEALALADAVREKAPDVAVTRLASGLPVGSDLEYADEITLGRALRGRHAL